MTYTIQLADADHVHQIVAIVNQEAQRSTATAAFVDEPVDRWVASYLNTHHKLPWLVALDTERAVGDRVIAFAKGSYYNAREGFQWSVELSVYARPDYHGQGIARRLYTQLFHLLAVQGYHRVYARIALPNISSQRLHEQFGLTQTGLLPQFAWKFGHWYDVAIYTGLITHSSQSDLPPPAKPRPTLSVLEGWRFIDTLKRQQDLGAKDGSVDQTSRVDQDVISSSHT